eukprot:gene1940-49958_t
MASPVLMPDTTAKMCIDIGIAITAVTSETFYQFLAAYYWIVVLLYDIGHFEHSPASIAWECALTAFLLGDIAATLNTAVAIMSTIVTDVEVIRP